MRIIILQDGKYNDAHHRAHKLKAGDVFETGETYGQSLIASGFARLEQGSEQPAESPAVVDNDRQMEEKNGEVTGVSTGDMETLKELPRRKKNRP